MANTISLLPKPAIKCYSGNNKLRDAQLHNTVNVRQESPRKLTDEDLLWTGESVYCICSHHVEQHHTIRDENGREITVHCHGNDERSNCEDFMTCSIRLSHRNCYKMVTEE